MKYIKIAIIDFLLWCGCVRIIQAVWQSVEFYLYGMTMPSLEDTFMGFLFSFFLWMVVRGWLKKEEEEHG